MSESFQTLTPERVLDAVERLGQRCTGRFLVLNSYENRVYQIELEPQGEDLRGEVVVAKFYRPGRWSQAALEAEHAFLDELAADEVPAVCPLPLSASPPGGAGGAVGAGEGRTLGETDGLYFALFPKVLGRAPEEPDDALLRRLGRLLARLHTVGARRPAPDRLVLTPETYGRKNLADLVENDHLPPEVQAQYISSVEALLSRIEPLFIDVPLHRIHGDCHAGNLLHDRHGDKDAIHLLDFDDFLTGPAVQDIFMLVPSADAEGRRQRGVLLSGYTELRDFDPAWLRLVEPLRALRYIHYSAWIARRMTDPFFQRTFPQFGSIVYWQHQVTDLREQCARIDDAA